MKYTTLILSLLVSMTMLAQEKAVKPLDVPMSFSGTYGELRHDHFHGGLDFRVGGKVGDEIHAIKSGYISRVTVSPWGYGNGMYLKHPDGTMSVYGHMLEFREDIAELVKKEQYKNESFSISLDFGPLDFPVKQGEILGKVGSTGSSAGPHLHMEVRDSLNVPLNYLSMGYYKVQDNLGPHFSRVAFYGYDSLPVPSTYKICMIDNPAKHTEDVMLPELSYVAVDAHDMQNGTTGKLAVEEYRVFLDGKQIFRFKVGNVGFDEGRYLKSLAQWGEKGADLIKTAVDPANLLSHKVDTLDGGIIKLEDYDAHNLSLEAYDEHGNKSVCKITLRRDDSIEAPQKDTTFHYLFWLWHQPNYLKTDSLTYILPAGSLFNSLNFRWKKIAVENPASGRYSATWTIGGDAPLRSAGKLRIGCDVPEELQSKAYIASENFGYVGPLEGATAGFGTYMVAVDQDPPVIRMDKYSRILVGDKKSGLKEVNVYIDGKWHLSMLKRGIVTILDKKSIPPGQRKLKVVATDMCDNEAIFEKIIKF